MSENNKLYSEIQKIYSQVQGRLDNEETNQYAALGNKYLQTLVTDIVYFQLKQQISYPQKFVNEKIALTISQILFGELDNKRLNVAMGKLYRLNDKFKIQTIYKELLLFISLHDKKLSDKSYSTFVFEPPSVSQSMLHVDNSASNLNSSQNQSKTEAESNNQNDSQQILSAIDHSSIFSNDSQNGNRNESQYLLKKEIQEYLQVRNGTTMINHLKGFKPVKTFQIEDLPQKVNQYCFHKVKLTFKNFLDKNQVDQTQQVGKAGNIKDAKEKANKLVLLNFFLKFPYIYRDFVHYTKSKNL